MKFDVILGNPPYQDGRKSGEQNKIYNQFAKKSMQLLSLNGIIAFITPVSVLKPSKRFSLHKVPGLKLVNFNINDYFPQIGVSICEWILDKNYLGEIFVLSKSGILKFDNNSLIYNPDEFDEKFIKIYKSLKIKTKHLENRMFKQNPVDSRTGRSKIKTNDHKYPIYKLQNGKEILIQYNKPLPKLHKKNKFVISLTKTLNEESCIVSTKDFDVNHVFVDVKDSIEVSNIKSFLFSDYLINLCKCFKKFDGYGFNNCIKFIPIFDKSKNWTNDDVRKFIESF